MDSITSSRTWHFIHHAPILLCDNTGATYLTSNHTFHACTKHIEIYYHFVRDKVASKQFQVKFLSSEDQLVNVLTKPLLSSRFSTMAFNLNMRPLPLRLRERIRTPSETVEASSSNATQSNVMKMNTKETRVSLENNHQALRRVIRIKDSLSCPL